MPFVDLRAQATRRDPQQMLKHLQTFSLELKFSAGIWFFSPPGSRFHDRYGTAIDVPARLEKAAALASYGLKALEAHYPSEIDEQNLPLWKKFSQQTGIRVLAIAPQLFWDVDFEFGSLSNPDEKVRRKAIERAKTTFRLNRELNTDFAIIWPGIDGYENPFGVDFFGMRDRFAAGLAEVMDEVPGVRIAFEPKPYEPRGHILYGTTVEGVLLGHKVEKLLKNRENQRLMGEGHALVCLNPEIGHVLMGFEDLAYAYSMPMEEGRLAHTHINSQPLGNYDQDLNAGVIGPEQLEAMLYALKMYGYGGYFGIDINPERMPVETALKNNFDALRAANDRINGLDHEAILFAQHHPEKERGWLEGYLIRQRAPHPEKLAPLARPL